MAKYAIAFDTKQFPGKIEVTYVEVSRELIDEGQKFDERTFTLLDLGSPDGRLLMKHFVPEAGR